MSESDSPPEKPPFSLGLLLLICVASYAAIGGLMFGVAGRVNLPWVWAALLVLAASHLVSVFVLRHDTGLIRERFKPGPGEPLWDRIILWALAAFFLANLIVAGLDVGRLHWLDTVPVALRAIGLVGTTSGLAITTWAMSVNTFFSKVVRIQSERGHRVIRGGPYRVVRHPGYTGFNLMWLGFNLAIGSWIGTAAGVIVNGLIVYRTIREDRFLREQLAGYDDYAHEVRWRLLPWIW